MRYMIETERNRKRDFYTRSLFFIESALLTMIIQLCSIISFTTLFDKRKGVLYVGDKLTGIPVLKRITPELSRYL